MKQSILRLFTCLILGVVFGTTAWAADGLSATTITLLKGASQTITYTDTNVDGNSSAAVLFSDEQSKSLITVEAQGEWNSDPATIKVTANATLTGTAKFQVKFTNPGWNHGGYSCTTETITVNVVDNIGGNTGGGGNNNGGSDTGTTPTPTNKSLTDKIADHDQLTDVPTIYLTIPAAEGKELNSVLKKITDPALDPYFDATIQVVDNSSETSEKHLKSFTDDVKIKVRGNSTANMDKKPYRLKFAKDEKDDAGNVTVKHKHDLLGDGYSKRNWTLLANAYDGSKIRNALNYRIGQLVGMEFCPGYKFVDLVINGEYRGCYQVSDHVEVGSHRIDVDEDTGWYVEASRGDMIEAPSATGGSLEMSIKNPEPATPAETEQLKADVKSFFDEFGQKAASYNTNLSDPILGWRSIADEESMVAFYIGTNLTANYDGFMTVKMFRDVTGNDTKLHFGPLWDMDLAYGHFKGSVPGKLVEDIENGNFRWYPKGFMENDARFVKKVHDKWHNLVENGLINELNAYIDKLADNVRQSQELDYNKKWTVRMKGMDGTYDSFDDAITYLKGFIADHVPLVQNYIDDQYNKLHCADLPDEPEDVDPTDPDDNTPVGDLGALKDLGNGKYSYTGSASTFKEGTEITITTSTASTTLSNYITEGTAWNTTKTITLTAADVTTLAANSYTFYMNATGGEVKAVNVKAPVASAGAEFNKEYTSSYTSGDFVVPASNFNANATRIKVILKNNLSNYSNGWNGNYGFNGHPWKAAYSWTTTNTQEITVTDTEDIQSVAQYGMGITGPKDMTITVINYGSSSGSGSSTTPTYALTLSASEGGTVSGAGTYAEGTTVLIKAIPNTGYKFVKWSDDNTYASRSVTLKEALTLTATFAAEGSADEDLFNEHGARKQFTNLPTIYLDATVGNEWSAASLEVFDADNKLGQGTSWTSSAVETQYQGSGDKNKDSYRLKFGSKTQLLSSGKFKQWVLLANDDDPTMMRNALAKEMGDALGLPFTPGYQFVDLYVNNTYMGTYQVTDRIKVESGRALVTGGNKDNDWHVRLNDEGEYNEDKPTYYIAGTTTAPYIIPKNPDPKDNETTWNSTLKSAMTTYFNNVFATDASGKYTAFAENVDHQQLFEWYISQEMLGVYKGFSSIEAYRSVAATDKNLHIGILWDSEKAFGNTGLAPAIDMSDLNANTYNGLMTNYAAYDVMKNIFTQLWQERWFANGVNNLWKEKHEAMLAAMTSKATALKTELEGSWAQNATKWNITGEQTTSIDAMTTWLTQRDAYLTKKFAALAAALPCENHTYENGNYIKQTDGTYRIGCDVCGTVKEDSETYYEFTVYPESSDATVVYATSWHPSEEHPNSIAVVEAKKSIVEKIEGWNIVCGKKSTLSDGTTGLTCKDFRLTDGHPYYSDNKFVATTATYTRPLAENEVYGMMTLPFKHQNAENDDAAFYHIASVENGKIQLVAIDPSIDGNASAYLPVIFKRKADAASITVTGADITVKKTSADKTNSTFEGWTIIGAVENTSVTADGLYEMSDAKLGKVAKAESLTIAPFRAYLSTTTSAPDALTFVCPGVTVTTLVDAIKQLTSGSLTKQDIDKIVEELLNKE